MPAQPAISIDDAAAAMSMEFDARGDPAALWARLPGLPALAAGRVVVGVGAPLAEAVGVELPGLRPFERLSRGRYTFPATQHALWLLVAGADAGTVFQAAERLRAELGGLAVLAEACTMFNYRQGRDLTGFKDGSANPNGPDAQAAAFVAAGEWAGASHALVQRYLHFRDRFAALPPRARNDAIGRDEASDEEDPEAPPAAHIKRTEQEDFDPPAFMLRRSMPWGDLRRHGLQFIAFMSAPDKAQRMLARMLGDDDGVQDALLAHTQAETGAYYFVPPMAGDRLHLPPARSAAMAPPAAPAPFGLPADPGPAATAPAGCVQIQLVENGPLALRGPCTIAGAAVTRATLCRCGDSANKPWCDGSHRKQGFVAAGNRAAADVSADLPAPPPGPAEIRALADGPLLVHGAVAIIGSDGRAISRTEGPTLCRCGHSANKPFCDGAHARIGFRAHE